MKAHDPICRSHWWRIALAVVFVVGGTVVFWPSTEESIQEATKAQVSQRQPLQRAVIPPRTFGAWSIKVGTGWSQEIKPPSGSHTTFLRDRVDVSTVVRVRRPNGDLATCTTPLGSTFISGIGQVTSAWLSAPDLPPGETVIKFVTIQRGPGEALPPATCK